MEIFDTIIIGAGPAGLTSAIYASRREMKTLIIGKETGGQLAWAGQIENYPGFAAVNNLDLANKMRDHVLGLNIKILNYFVDKISKENGVFIVSAESSVFYAKTIILAIGLVPRHLNVPGETLFIGKGISYCANCDGPLYKNKNVAVIGGGNSALDAAELMSKIAKNVYLIHRYDKFQAFEKIIEKVNKAECINIYFNHEVKEILGDKKVSSIKIVNIPDKTESVLPVDGIFIEVGHEAKTDLIKDLVKIDGKGQIVIDEKGSTSQEGIFAAGDATTVPYKQIVTACGQGAIAALSAYQYLQLQQNS